MNTNDFANQVARVTGAATGIGRNGALERERFIFVCAAEHGADPAMAGRRAVSPKLRRYLNFGNGTVSNSTQGATESQRSPSREHGAFHSVTSLSLC